ncbi:MAG TPA: hypothetical protein VGJ05_11030 [Fimbriiglobus sp.]|jgi:hypothetical protein
MKRLVAAGLLTALGTASLAAADPLPPSAAPRLIEKLGAVLYSDRESAVKELLKLGPSVLPLVESAAKSSSDAEVRARAARVAEVLRTETDTAIITRPATLRLNYKNIPLGTLISEIKAKTGINLVLDPDRVKNPLRLVTVNVPGAVPAWQAVEEVCKAAGLVEEFKSEIPAPANKNRNEYQYYSPYGPRVDPPPAAEVAVTLADGKYRPNPGSRSTAVRVLALPARFPGSRVVRGAGQVVISLDVTPLPSVNWLDALSIHVYKAEDETGRPVMTSQRPDGSSCFDPYSNAWGGGMVFWDGGYNSSTRPTTVYNPRVVPVVLKTDDRGSKELRVLEGGVLGDATIKDAPLIVIDNLANAVNTTYAGSLGTQLTVSHFEKEKDGKTKLMLRVERIPQSTFLALRRGRVNPNIWGWGGSIESSGGNGFLKQMKFYDSTGKQLKSPTVGGGSSMFDGTKQTEDCNFTFAVGTNPVKMVMTGTKLVTVEIPFRLEHVKLP